MARNRTPTDVYAATNAHVGSVVDYGVDPRGWSTFAALSGAHSRALTGQRAVIDTESTNHHGYMRPLQALRGLAPLILGSARAITPTSSVIGDERSDQLDNAAERILAERWRRQGGGPDW